MSAEDKQTYGLFIPKLNLFMTVEATYQEFQAILAEYQLDPKGCTPMPKKVPYEEKFDDFDHIVEEVSKAPFDPLSLDLKEFDL